MQELKETLRLLKEAGVKAELCDCPVRVTDCPVKCGAPQELGDADLTDYVLLPKSLVGSCPELFITADGDSMIGAGYEPGDQLRIRVGAAFHDGDNVVAWLDGRCTVKSLFTDEEGQRWLVPQNDKYDAIQLRDDMNVQILAVVIGVEKRSPRASSRSLMQAIRRTKNKQKAACRRTDAEVDKIVVTVGSEVQHARQWYAVYRALVDHEATAEGDYQAFCSRVRALLPDHRHLPDPKEIARMSVLSFAKPVALWVATNAPVGGARFKDYLRIARSTTALLSA